MSEQERGRERDREKDRRREREIEKDKEGKRGIVKEKVVYCLWYKKFILNVEPN